MSRSQNTDLFNFHYVRPVAVADLAHLDICPIENDVRSPGGDVLGGRAMHSGRAGHAPRGTQQL